MLELCTYHAIALTVCFYFIVTVTLHIIECNTHHAGVAAAFWGGEISIHRPFPYLMFTYIGGDVTDI